VIVITELHTVLLAQFTTFVELVHGSLQLIHILYHVVVQPWADHIPLTHCGGIFDGIFPLIGKILLRIIPVAGRHHRVTAWHQQVHISQQFLKVFRIISIKFPVDIVGMFYMLIAHIGNFLERTLRVFTHSIPYRVKLHPKSFDLFGRCE